ncbi:MAG: response regulator [Chloroflexi bacterium]|nr:response regulator [Chloroflexota bacterium]
MGTKKKLLVIDDDPDFVEVIVSILEDADYEVDAKYNPDEGFEALKTGSYDLLLLDVLMGRGAEGIMIARKIGDDERLRETPILIITGMREQIAFLFPGQPVHPSFVPIDELIEKPVKPDLLLEKVSELLRMAEERKAQTQTN